MFRVTISGTFDADAGRAALPPSADLFGIAFTEAGTFTHDGSAFTFRCQVPAGPDDGEDEAGLGALAALDAYGVGYRVLRLAVTDQRTVKIPRKRR